MRGGLAARAHGGRGPRDSARDYLHRRALTSRRVLTSRCNAAARYVYHACVLLQSSAVPVALPRRFASTLSDLVTNAARRQRCEMQSSDCSLDGAASRRELGRRPCASDVHSRMLRAVGTPRRNQIDAMSPPDRSRAISFIISAEYDKQVPPIADATDRTPDHVRVPLRADYC